MIRVQVWVIMARISQTMNHYSKTKLERVCTLEVLHMFFGK